MARRLKELGSAGQEDSSQLAAGPLSGLTSEPLRVALIAEHEAARQLVQAAIWERARGWRLETFANVRSFMSDSEAPSVVLVESLTNCSAGVSEVELLCSACPGLPVVLLTSCRQASLLHLTLAAGACGCVITPALPLEAARAVLRATHGVRTFCPAAEQILFGCDVPAESNGVAGVVLTKAEKEVIVLASRGLRLRDIADAMRIEERTAHAHRNHILRKFNVHKLADAVSSYFCGP